MNSQVSAAILQNVNVFCHYRTAYVLDLWITNAPLFTKHKSVGALGSCGMSVPVNHITVQCLFHYTVVV